MASLNFTFQEASPLISYSGLWTEGSPANDSLWFDYNGSFRVTQVAQSTATLTFLGTGVSLFGATRPNHGNYTVSLDLEPLFTAYGSTSDSEFNKSLWHANDLPYTEHTVTLTNVPIPNQPFLDLDFVSIERLLGQPGDTIYDLTLDDTSPSISFVGPWEASSGVSSAYQGTLHTTQTANAQVLFSFQGCSIELYGQYANAPYTVVLDNEPAVSLQGLNVDLTPNFQHPQTLLYLADGLSETSNHTVTLTNSNSNQNRPFFFDYAIIRSTQNFNGMANVTAVPSNSQTTVPTIISTGIPNSQSPAGASTGASNSNHSTPVGAIAGGIAGALVVVLGIGVLLLLMRRRRQRADGASNLDLIDNEPKPYYLPTNASFVGEPREQPQVWGRALPTVPPSVRNVPSKLRPASVSYGATQSTPTDDLISPQERSEPSGTRSHADTASSTTFMSTSRSATESPQSASFSSPSRRGTTMTRPSVSQSRAGRSSQGQAVHEEDAGVLVDSTEALVPRTLPPAYNPTWGQRQ